MRSQPRASPNRRCWISSTASASASRCASCSTAAYAQEPNEKAALFRIIGEIADEAALPELIGRLQGKDPIARLHIINILARFNKPEVQRALQQLARPTPTR